MTRQMPPTNRAAPGCAAGRLRATEFTKIPIRHVRTDFVQWFGDRHDGAMETAVTAKGGVVVEAGYYFGDDKGKNIVDVSSQAGCPNKCVFCDLGKEKFVRNLTKEEIIDQVRLVLLLAGGYGFDLDNTKHKIDFGKTGEPLLNGAIVPAVEKLAELSFSYKLCTTFPDSRMAYENFRALARFASRHSEPFQPQISLVSTSEAYRRRVIGTNIASFDQLRASAEQWANQNPEGRRINLSIILSEDTPCDVRDVYGTLPPELFNMRIRKYVATAHGRQNGLHTADDARIRRIQESFREKGYSVRDEAMPTAVELRSGLASNVTRRRYIGMIDGKG